VNYERDETTEEQLESGRRDSHRIKSEAAFAHEPGAAAVLPQTGGWKVRVILDGWFPRRPVFWLVRVLNPVRALLSAENGKWLTFFAWVPSNTMQNLWSNIPFPSPNLTKPRMERLAEGYF